MESELDLIEVDGTFFTKDNIQVRTIYFENIPDKKDVLSELEEYFSKYGKLYNVEIEKHYKTYSDELKISGIVQYETPESAYRALKQKQKNDFIVLPADSWIQPTITTNQLEIIKETGNYCSLVNLGEDLLMLILSKLSLRDMITLLSVFPHLKSSIRQYYKYVKKIKLNYKETKNLTLLQIRQFLIDNSDVIEDLEILDWHYNINSIRFLNFALHFCNLKSIHISSISFKDKDFSWRIWKEFPKLEKLKLVDCRISDQDIQNLSQLSNLRLLDLSGTNNSFSGTYLHNFAKLKELSLENCEDLSPDNFEKIDFSNLETLNICGCLLVNSSFKTISESAKKLKILKMSFSRVENNQFENFIMKIENLEKLIIVNASRTGCTGYYIEIPNMSHRIKKLSESEFLRSNLIVLHLIDFKLNNECFEYLAKFKNLLEVAISFSYEENVPQGFWSFLNFLKKLKTLALKIDGFKSFETDFIIELVEYFNKKEQHEVFTITAEISKSVYRNILKNLVYLQCKDKIKVEPFYFTEAYSHHALSES